MFLYESQFMQDNVILLLNLELQVQVEYVVAGFFIKYHSVPFPFMLMLCSMQIYSTTSRHTAIPPHESPKV